MSMQEDPAPVPQWRVTGQAMSQVRNASGQFVPGYVVTFQLPSGTTGSVEVPQQSYNAGNVKAAITEAAKHLTAVDSLTADTKT